MYLGRSRVRRGNVDSFQWTVCWWSVLRSCEVGCTRKRQAAAISNAGATADILARMRPAGGKASRARRTVDRLTEVLAVSNLVCGGCTVFDLNLGGEDAKTWESESCGI